MPSLVHNFSVWSCSSPSRKMSMISEIQLCRRPFLLFGITTKSVPLAGSHKRLRRDSHWRMRGLNQYSLCNSYNQGIYTFQILSWKSNVIRTRPEERYCLGATWINFLSSYRSRIFQAFWKILNVSWSKLERQGMIASLHLLSCSLDKHYEGYLLTTLTCWLTQ